MQLWPVLAIFLGSLVYEKAVQDVASHEQTLSRDAVAASRALLAPASIVGQSPTRVKCKHHRDAVKLNQELEKLKKYIIDGDFWNLKSLLESWKRPNAYVHNLNQLHNAEDYAQMHCSDLDYLARTPVWYEEPKYDSHDDTARNQLNNSTVLELALHMTRKANERVLMGFLYEQWIVGDQFSMARRRVGIVRLLLESGFLWGSGDLICKVVPEENDYRKEVREAFARTVLHDLVRNDVHLNEDQLSLMKKSKKCGGNDMDGVVWVLAQAPGAFTMLGLLERQTVLMHAAQDADQHDKASISFKELVQLYLVMQMPLTTVDPYGWNAEMLAARKLRRNHVEVLRHEVVGTWYRDYKEACKKWLSTSDFMSNALSDGYVNASLMFARLARILLVVFVILLMLLIVDGCQSFCGCQWDPIWRIKTEVQKCGWDYDDAGFLLLVDMSFRVLWLLMINTAFLQVPPLLTTGYENQVLPGVGNIPSVSIWNPLPMTAVVIGCLSLVSATLWAYFDYCNAVPNWAADEKTAEWAARSSLDTASYQHSTRPTKFASTATTSAKMETSSSTIPASTTASYPPGNKPTWSSSFGLICDEKEVQKKLKKPIPEDRFQDPTSHFLGCVCIFVLVTSLMVIYIETILQPLGMNPKRMGLWLGALLVQVRITLDDKTLKEEEGYNKTPPTKKHQASQREAYYYSQLQLCEHQATDLASDFESEGDEHGAKKTPEHSDAQLLRHWLRWACCMVTPENREMWGLHLSARRWNSSITREAEAEAKVVYGWWRRPCIFFRFVMSYVSSGLYKAIIVYTLPLWLCRGGMVDFVLNAFALVYIVELDDVKDEQKVP